MFSVFIFHCAYQDQLGPARDDEEAANEDSAESIVHKLRTYLGAKERELSELQQMNRTLAHNYSIAKQELLNRNDEITVSSCNIQQKLL